MHQNIKIGDIVRINPQGAERAMWGTQGKVGLVIAPAKRIHVPAFKVMVMNEIAEFDIDEFEVVSESR